MIAVVGATNTTLRKIMLGIGIPVPNAMNRHTIDCLFNASFTPSQFAERVPAWAQSLPTINRNLVVNKKYAVEKLAAGGLEDHIPEMSEAPKFEGNWIVKPYASQAGRGIKRYVVGSAVPSGSYIQRDVKKFREFRAHVGLWLEDPVFTIQEKKPKPELWEQVFEDVEYHWPADGESVTKELPVTWNIESGFYFKRLTDPENRFEKRERFPLIKRIEELAVKGIKGLGYQYGAVDILMNWDRELFIVEINSHPAILNPMSVEVYKDALSHIKLFNASMMRVLLGTGTHSVTFRRATQNEL